MPDQFYLKQLKRASILDSTYRQYLDKNDHLVLVPALPNRASMKKFRIEQDGIAEEEHPSNNFFFEDD